MNKAGKLLDSHKANIHAAAQRWAKLQGENVTAVEKERLYNEYCVHLGRAQGLAEAYAIELGVEYDDIRDGATVTTDVWRKAETIELV